MTRWRSQITDQLAGLLHRQMAQPPNGSRPDTENENPSRPPVENRNPSRPPLGGSGPPFSARLGVLISGRGSNLQAIIDAVSAGALDATIAVVISNRADAPGLQRARDAGIEALSLSPRS